MINDTNVLPKEPVVVELEKPVGSNKVLTNDQSQITSEPVVQPSNEVQTTPVLFPRRLRIEKEEAQKKKSEHADDEIVVRISQVLRMPHQLHSNLIMFHGLILSRYGRRMTMRLEEDYRTILLIGGDAEMMSWTSRERPVPCDQLGLILRLPDVLYSFPPASHYHMRLHLHPRFLSYCPTPDTQLTSSTIPPSPVLSSTTPSPIRSLGYRAAMIRMRAEAAATSHSLPLPPPFILSPTRPYAPPPMPTSAPTSLPPLLLPSASRDPDRHEVNLPLEEVLGIALVSVTSRRREIRRDPERYVGYGITDSWDEIVETLQGAPVSTDTELGAHVREYESMVRRAHAYPSFDGGLRLGSLEWLRVRSIDADVALQCARVLSLRTTVHAQMSEITELQLADRSR
ncbi:hypothetical protein Tco_0339196 [Tanacetum coccineum]